MKCRSACLPPCAPRLTVDPTISFSAYPPPILREATAVRLFFLSSSCQLNYIPLSALVLQQSIFREAAAHHPPGSSGTTYNDSLAIADDMVAIHVYSKVK